MSSGLQLPDPLPTNDAVEWTGQRFGLHPYLDVGSELGSAGPGGVEALAPRLVGVLREPDRFVVAHVLLTRLTKVAHPTFPDWNGLAVELAADGSAHVDPAQREVLARRWAAWLATVPHPPQLPPDEGGRLH
jgi:hypothetical protein